MTKKALRYNKCCKRCNNYYETPYQYGKVCDECKTYTESSFYTELKGGKKNV